MNEDQVGACRAGSLLSIHHRFYFAYVAGGVLGPDMIGDPIEVTPASCSSHQDHLVL